MVVALGGATADGRALFGHTCAWPTPERHWLQRTPGRVFAPGEKVQTQIRELPQVRQTYTVLGSQSSGLWGYHQGVNDQGVAVGVASLGTRQGGEPGGLLATDLVRLALERSASALQAVDTLTDLIGRHGQFLPPSGPVGELSDSAFLVADGREAFALEASGRHWVYQEVREVRALSDACTIRQDWNRIAPGLATQVIDRGWWPEDGSKLDFAGALASNPAGRFAGLRRWGRATMLLQQQNGHIDTAFLRRLLADHGEGQSADLGRVPLCQHGQGSIPVVTALSSVAELGEPTRRWPLVWIAFGPPCETVYFPLCLAGDLPESFCHGGRGPTESVWQRVSRLRSRANRDSGTREVMRESLLRLQARLDQEADEFAAEAAGLHRSGASSDLHRQAGLFMQHVLELFEEVAAGLSEVRSARRVTASR
jgi:dipeptidase